MLNTLCRLPDRLPYRQSEEEVCACVDMLIEVDVCKTVVNDVCLQKGESHGNILFRRIQLFGHGLIYEAIRASRVDEC